MLETIIIASFALAGAITQRIVGFGITSILAPILLIYYSPPIAVTVSLLAATSTNIVLLIERRHFLQLSRPIILRLFVWAVPGLLLGSYIVTQIDKAWLQILMGALIILGIAIQQYFLPKPHRKLGVSRGIGPAGFAAGLLNGTAALAPPPLVMYMRSHIIKPDQMRQMLAASFILMNLASILTIHYFQPSSLTDDGLKIFVLLVPIIIVGNLVGRVTAAKINPKQYQMIVFAAIIVAGLGSIALGLANL